MKSKEKQELIMQIMEDLTDVFIKKVPPEIMKESSGAAIMYDTALNYLYHVAMAVDMTEEDVIKHIKLIFESKRMGDLN